MERGGRCCNPSLGLATKARASKGACWEWSLGVTFHAFKNVGECEGMNPHTPMAMHREYYKGRWWFPPSSGRGESCEFVYACDSSMHQKCFNYTLINLLFGLCRFVWIINPLIIRLSAHPRDLAHPSTPEVLQVKERTPTPSSIILPLDS